MYPRGFLSSLNSPLPHFNVFSCLSQRKHALSLPVSERSRVLWLAVGVMGQRCLGLPSPLHTAAARLWQMWIGCFYLLFLFLCWDLGDYFVRLWLVSLSFTLTLCLSASVVVSSSEVNTGTSFGELCYRLSFTVCFRFHCWQSQRVVKNHWLLSLCLQFICLSPVVTDMKSCRAPPRLKNKHTFICKWK